MAIQRLSTAKERAQIRESKKFKGRNIKDLSEIEKEELLEIICKKLGIL